ncbi:MAG TPA: hypothetical protein VH643_36655 [Gemmataceae bacterium]|jgi:hydrogenase maturation protease
MNRALVDPIADTVLYEGYILYPYRPSVKNRQRWTFGGLYPEAYCREHSDEASANQTEVLVRGTAATSIEAVVRFLHLTQRIVGATNPPLPKRSRGGELPFRPVETLRLGEQTLQTWQEAEEREVAVEEVTVGELSSRPRLVSFTFPGGRLSEPIHHGLAGEVAALLIRVQQAIAGSIEIQATQITEGLFRLTCRVENRTPASEIALTPPVQPRDKALLCSLISAHTLLGVRGGEFVSLLDPPECWREVAAACRNVGVWPVLVGAEGQTDTMLASPIILYDYPQVAAESPGDFFDGTEIDEMLTLRILTLTDEEKRAMAAVDEKARDLLARTETRAREQFGLHGTIRESRPTAEDSTHG